MRKKKSHPYPLKGCACGNTAALQPFYGGRATQAVSNALFLRFPFAIFTWQAVHDNGISKKRRPRGEKHMKLSVVRAITSIIQGSVFFTGASPSHS